MSHRLGSNINSPFFMNDPVPVNNTGNRSNFHNNDQSYLIKGETSNNNSYEHVGGDDDIFIINDQNGSFQLHRKTLKDVLSELKTHAHTPVRQLTPEISESFKSIVEALRLLYGSQALYDLILADIRSEFFDVNDVKPGTVSAFFIGCFSDDKFPGPMGCSPKCAASLPPSEGTPGYANCDDLVLIYTDGLFSSLNVKRTSHAYIYIEDPNFSGFNPENIRQLNDADIKNASLVFGNSDGSYREITSSLTIDQLPRKSSLNTNNSTTASTTSTTSSSNSGAGVALAIIIIIIIILLLVIFYQTYYP